jgi:hypothetical protein
MVSHESAIIIAAIMILFSVVFGLMFQGHEALAQTAREEQQALQKCKEAIKQNIEDPPKTDGGLAVSGTNIYAAWTCNSNVLFTGSHDGGKTFANTMLLSSSTPNTNPKTFVLNDNVSISASGNNVAIMWDTNKTGGISNPIIRTSSDGGNTFGDIVTLNSTSGGINK